MTAERSKHAYVAGLLVAAPFLYVSSLGPAIFICMMLGWPSGADTFFQITYAPLEALEHVPGLSQALDWYISRQMDVVVPLYEALH